MTADKKVKSGRPKKNLAGKEKLPEKKTETPIPGIELGRKSLVSTESALQEQVEAMELQEYDLLEKLNMVTWSERNMGRVLRLQKNQIYLKLNRLENNIAVVRKQIKLMEDKMPEDEADKKPDEPDKKPDEPDKDDDSDDDDED
ncbi:MAG: hypothetical protein E3J56_01145 [Candidatus Aminicenantes bacterium]|nr:MAG: hypothetical protein E3J56_01145 [Candidatus Aminicenantes bacterium]